jgi:hypothetical protein
MSKFSFISFCFLSVLLIFRLSVDAQEKEAGHQYDKPFIEQGGKGTLLGGYIDHELFWNKKKKTFDQHRFIPFIYSEVSDRIHVLAELEFEHGGLVKGTGDSDGEIKIEFAVLDIEFSKALTYRAGVVLVPLGSFNLNHDSPLNDLTNRPLVAREIVPTTLSESGMGFYGEWYPSDATVLNYEVYVVNGFKEAAATSLRSGRGSLKADNNEEKSLTGRLGYSPFLGLQLGGSFHVGAYDDAGEQSLGIYAIDANYNRGPLDLRGEYAQASIDGVDADSRSGYYAQAGYHFLPGAVRAFPNSIFTASFRYDYIDLDTRDETRLSFGLNWRPEEATVIKVDYEIYDTDEDSSGIIFSVASYF